jgi:hypothetical protein
MKLFKLKKELTREQQTQIITQRVAQARKLYDHWINISRAFHRGEKVNLMIDERPDESNLKS